MLVCAVALASARAADVSPESEYARRIKVYQTIQPHGETPFGENVNLYTGDLTFQQADVVVEGNGPAISLVRSTVSLMFDTQLTQPHAFGDWTLSVPRIETLVDNTYGWITESGADPTKRCSQFDRPFYSTLMDKGWHGIEMVTESGDRQQLIKRGSQNTLAPTMTDAGGNPIAFPIVTQQNWQIGCLGNTINGQPGEGFFVVTPNGTKYWFDYLIYHGANAVIESDGGEIIRQRRKLATMYVSRIEDRFGNSLVYAYGDDDKLDSVTASDGRQVTLTWRTDSRLVDRITLQPAHTQPRVWQYQYANITAASARLTGVVLPDNSRWSFDLHGIGAGGLLNLGLGACDIRTLANSSDMQVSTVTHPSGLVGNFSIAATWHARNYVPSACMYPAPPTEGDPWEDNPPLFGTNSLRRKEFSGPGVTTQVWTYAYEPAVGSTTADACASAGTCPATKWVNVVNPAGDQTTYLYSNRWGETESKLLRTETYQGTAAPALRTEVYTYAPSGQGPWPTSLGNALDDARANTAKAVTWTPTRQRQVTQQGRTFIWQVASDCGSMGTQLCFDTFARPTKVTKSSASAQ